MKRCKRCINADTRIGITFTEDGVCGPCEYFEIKRTIDWAERKKQLHALCDKYRLKDGRWDCVIPVSGGKDSSTVAWKMKHDYGMNPLCVMNCAAAPSEIGEKNFNSFIASGFDCIKQFTNKRVRNILARRSLIEYGDCRLPDLYGKYSAPYRMAIAYKIPLIIYGEDANVEYGGSAKTRFQPIMDYSFAADNIWKRRDIFKLVDGEEITIKDMNPYLFPNKEEANFIVYTHFSYFENWVSYENYQLSKEKCGYSVAFKRSPGTYTNWASLDDYHEDFHYYWMWAKFGTCRATSDAAHDVREGRITREQGLEYVMKYDGEFPERYFEQFLDDLQITKKEFWDAFDKFRNLDIWEKKNGKWQLKDPTRGFGKETEKYL